MYYKTLFESLISPFLTFLGLIKGTFYEIEAITMLDVKANMFTKTFSYVKCGVNPLILVLWRLRQEDLNSSLHVTLEGLGHLGIRDGTLSEKL